MDRDAAAVDLALRHAKHLDVLSDALTELDPIENPSDYRRVVASYRDFARMLQETLDRLGMNPAARPVRPAGTEAGGDPASAALDGLRADAAAGTAGVDYAAVVDPAVTEADAAD
jgi:hypothetical protein